MFRIVDLFHDPEPFLVRRWNANSSGVYDRGMKLRRGQQQMTADLGLPRLETPYVREHGELRPATWDEALERAAQGFGRARDAIAGGNANAFGLFSCSKATNEVNYLTQKFGRVVMGSNNIDSCNRT